LNYVLLGVVGVVAVVEVVRVGLDVRDGLWLVRLAGRVARAHALHGHEHGLHAVWAEGRRKALVDAVDHEDEERDVGKGRDHAQNEQERVQWQIGRVRTWGEDRVAVGCFDYGHLVDDKEADDGAALEHGVHDYRGNVRSISSLGICGKKHTNEIGSFKVCDLVL
jgi:hypothetical protein